MYRIGSKIARFEPPREAAVTPIRVYIEMLTSDVRANHWATH